MQELYLEDYDVNLQFPDEMSEDRIMQIIQRDYPEPDEKLVARFENPDTPASSLTREDFSRYKAAKPEIGLTDLPGIAVEAAAMTASRIIENLPSAVATYANVFDPGTSARTFMEGAARGMYDTETLVKMGNNYLRSKLESFGGTSENEMDDEFKRFLGVKEMQNIRGAIERGEQGAWNEYAEFAGLDAAKIDLTKVDRKAAEMTGEIIDPTLIIPAGKLGGAASRAMARVASKPVRMAGRGAEIAAEYGREAIERGKNVVRGATDVVDEATGGLGNVVVPGGVATAVASGIVGAGTAQTLGAVVAAPTILDVSGGLLKGFGEAMAHTPTRLGGLGRLALHQPDTIAGRMAGRLKFLDTPIEYAGRAAGGAAIGAGFGGAIGLASGGLEGLAAGIGSGGVLGMAGGGLGRAVEGLTGSSLRNAQDADFERWVGSKSPEDRARLESLPREAGIARMDAEQILLQSSVEVRHVDPDFVVDDNGTQMGQSSGMMRVEAGKPVVFLNTNADIRTMLHETLHALGRLDGFDTLISNVKNTFQRMYSGEEMNAFIRNYEDKLGREISLSSRQIEKFRGAKDAKIDYILEELAAEYFANYIKGKNSNYIFSGNNFSESLKGIFSRFTKGKLDRVYDAFQSPLFENQIKQSRQLDRAMRDLVKARKKAGRDVEASIDEPVKVYSDADLADDATFAELEAMGVAKTDSKGKRFIMKDAEQKRVAKERATTIGGILDNVSDPEGGLIKQPDGSYKGTRFSAGQLKALLDSPLINDTIKAALRQLDKISRSDQYVNMTYGAATMKTKLGKTKARNLPISNRNGLMYDIIISPLTGTMAGRVLDMSVTETRASRLYRQSPEMQQLFGSEANMFADLHTYINALTAGEKRTAEVLGSQRKSDFLNKILAIRNVKGNPEIPQVELTPRQRRLAEGRQDHPWRSFRLDRLVAMQQKEGRPIMSFSEAAYQRGQTHFMPDVDQYGYRMAHRAPDGTYGEGSIDKMNTVYPDDIYSSNGARYYGDDDFESRKTIQLFRSLRGKPEAELTIYRAVPKGVSGVINPGDWVTPSRKYAELHAKYFDETGADIIEKKVKAKEVYSEGNSIFEFGWNPKAPGDARFSTGTGRSKADQDYLKAAKSKDFRKLAGMVDDAANQAGYNSPTLYHGSIDPNLNRLDPRSAVEVEGGVFMTTNEDVASPYSYERAYGDIISEEPLGKVYTVKAKMQNPLEYVPGMVRGTPKPNAKYIDAVEMGDAIRAAKQAGHDGLIIRNIDDTIGMTGDMSDVYVAFNADQIKSADPITYNDDGSIIPLSERFKDTTDDIRFSPAADRPSVVRRTLDDPAESGTPLNGVVTLTPSVMSRFSPATNDPGYDIKQLAGKKAFIMMADRMKVGEYTARSGRVFELRGGPDHPDLADNQGTIAWAVEGGSIASQLERAINQTDGIGLVVLQKEESVAGNKTYSEVMLEEFKYDIENNPDVKRDLPQLLKKASAMIQKKAKQEREKKDKEAKAEAKAEGKDFTPSKPSKWETFEFTSMNQIEEAIPEMTFGARKTMWQQLASNDYKKKYDGVFWKDMYNQLNDFKDDAGYRTGDIVKVIQFDKSAPNVIIDPRDLGLPVHPSYQYGVLGKSISNVKGRMSAYDLLRKAFTDRVDKITGEMKPTQQISKEGDIGSSVFRVMQLRGLTDPDLQPKLTETSLDPRKQEGDIKLKSEYGKGRTEKQMEIRKEANRFSPQRSLNNRGGAVYTTAEGHRAVQTSSRAGVRVYGPTGRRVGPVFGSIEEAERFLNR